MAITAKQVHTILYRLPDADGTISISDAGHVLWAMTWGVTSVSVGGTLTPTGALSRVLAADRSVEGSLTPTGALARLISVFRALDGSLTPEGAVETIGRFIIAISGELTPTGTISARNPAWLLIDERLRWMGEWDVTTTYDKDDVVLHQAGSEWHVFVSKVIHNTGNTPTSSITFWRRFYQEQWL